jgi:hypothetical protein
MRRASLRITLGLLVFGPSMGCTGEVNNPKMPEIAPVKIQVDTTAPKGRGEGGQPYGASKKYQDMMNK